MERAGALAARGTPVAIGFEAPIWTPRRMDLARITGRRGGVEARYNRAWSAGAGAGALGAGPVTATTSLAAFLAGRSRILLWEAFVLGILKTTGLHHDDARLAVEAFAARWPEIETDVPAEPAMSHAAVAASIAGFRVDPAELGAACLVVAVTPATVVDPTAA